MSDLRHAALACAGRDGRVADVLRRARVVVSEREGMAWESSDGTVRAADVRLVVDGHALGLVERSPAVRDAVIAALAAAAPIALGMSVADVAFAWGLREQSGSYRGGGASDADATSAEDVRRALAAFLAASGDEEAAAAVDAARLSVHGDGLRIEPPLEASVASRVADAWAALARARP